MAYVLGLRNFFVGVQVTNKLNAVLIVGSAPDSVLVRDWDLSPFASRVAINNAWQILDGWSHLIYPEDFAPNKLPNLPIAKHKKLITAQEYVPQQNHFGGFVYAGGTMAFTAGYWALGALKPDLMAYVGCDMVYSNEKNKSSHFYGNGTADPLRADLTLQSLEAKSIRLMALAHSQNCAVINLSQQPESRLRFPRTDISDLSLHADHASLLDRQGELLSEQQVLKAFAVEKELGYMVPSGRYWEHESEFDKNKLREVDGLWTQAFTG